MSDGETTQVRLHWSQLHDHGGESPINVHVLEASNDRVVAEFTIPFAEERLNVLIKTYDDSTRTIDVPNAFRNAKVAERLNMLRDALEKEAVR